MNRKDQTLAKDGLWEKMIMTAVFLAAMLTFLFLHGQDSVVQAHANTFTIGSGAEKCTFKITSDTSDKRTACLVEISPSAKKLTVAMTETDESTGKTYKITEIDPGAMAFHTNLKTVLIGENVRKIGNYAFYGCSKLSKVTFYAKSLKKVGTGAFDEIKDGAVLRVEAKDKAHYKQLKKILKQSGMSNVKHQYRYK